MGADCSLRKCPEHTAWADEPIDVDVAHEYAECSNKGVCDRETGECEVRAGVYQPAGSRSTSSSPRAVL